MKKNIAQGISILLLSAPLISTAQTPQEHKAIDQLCGCFEVTFNYSETFTNDKSKQYISAPLNNKKVIEYVHPIKKTNDEYVLQHILVVNDNMMIKHWREDWIYQNNVVWDYVAENTWKKRTINADQVKGEWTQTVWEVSDAPRYQGSSKWVSTNNQMFWLNTADAPLPRREYTTRKDYNILNRTNRLIVSDQGYMHEQDNIKIIRTAGQTDSILAYEKGYNKYVRVDDSKCAKAKDFWQKKAPFWTDVVAVWDSYFEKHGQVEIKFAVDSKQMFEALDELEKTNPSDKTRKQEIEKVLSKYITAK